MGKTRCGCEKCRGPRGIKGSSGPTGPAGSTGPTGSAIAPSYAGAICNGPPIGGVTTLRFLIVSPNSGSWSFNIGDYFTSTVEGIYQVVLSFVMNGSTNLPNQTFGFLLSILQNAGVISQVELPSLHSDTGANFSVYATVQTFITYNAGDQISAGLIFIDPSVISGNPSATDGTRISFIRVA